MSEELKPCPFCGSDAITMREFDEESWSGYDTVECDKCSCALMGGEADDWNTRSLTPKQQHADEMYELLEKLTDPSNCKKDIIHLIGNAESLLAKARGETK